MEVLTLQAPSKWGGADPASDRQHRPTAAEESVWPRHVPTLLCSHLHAA